jgi:selenide,water dikinase
MEEAIELAAEGTTPGGTRRNVEAMQHLVRADGLDEAPRTILFDAQTSGGLLLAVPPERTQSLTEALTRKGTETAAVIGSLTDGDGTISVG